MGKIRFVGRARGGRCVFCHDNLSGDVRTCPECHAAWHPECGADARRCPSLGCGGPAPGEEERRGRRRRRRERAPTPAAPVVRHAREGRGPPGFLARIGPYTRLAFSALVTALLLTVCAAFALWPVLGPGSFWEFCRKGNRGSIELLPFAILKGLMVLGMALVGGWVAGKWLAALPSVWRELGQLLDSTTPTAMRLSITSEGSGKHTKWFANLAPAARGGQGGTHKIPVGGLLPPFWLYRMSNVPVLVYGLPPPGPYILEFEDGWLALVHPGP